MSTVTVTAIQTISSFVAPSISESFTTTTTRIWTAVPATPGETIVIGPTSAYAAPTVGYTPSFSPTQTFSATEYAIFLEGPQGDIWSTVILDTSPDDFVNPHYPPGDTVFVVPYPCNTEWSCWSKGQKVGLIVGVVFGGFFLLLLLCCLRKWHKRNIWISHGAHGANDYERWQNSHPGWGYYGSPQTNLQTGWGLRPYVTPAQAEAALRGGAPAPAAPSGGEAKEESKKEPPKGIRQKLAAWIGG